METQNPKAMSPYPLETSVWYIVLIIYATAYAWFLLTNFIQFCVLFFTRYRNQQLGADQSSAGDIELGETTRINPARPRIQVLPAIFEILLPDIPGAKPLTMYDDADECAVCLEDFKEKEVCWVLARCNHVFHKPCAEEWMRISLSCPICRTNAYFIIDV